VITVNQVHERDEEVFRVVTLVEVWEHCVVVRWLQSSDAFVDAVEAAGGGPIDFRQGPAAEDDVGTEYRPRSTGSAGGFTGMETADTWVPAPPPEAAVLRFTWPGGEETVVPLDRS
jgi:hypothetical protein